MTDLKDHISQMCRDAGLRRKALAARMGTTPSQVSKLLNGQTKLSEAWLDRIAEALQVEPTALWPDNGAGRQVALFGTVGAGGQVKRARSNGADVTPPSFVAVRDEDLVVTIDDAELWPMERGWRLYFTPADLGQCFSRTCLVELQDGRLLVKRLRAGSHATINLEHFNPMVPTIVNVNLKAIWLLTGIDTCAKPRSAFQ